MPPARKKPAPAPVVEPDEELEELEVDETDEVEEDEAPKKSAAEEVVFGASDLAKFLSEGREKPITAREIRTLIRKMARDGSGRVNREIIPGNRSRYNWSPLRESLPPAEYTNPGAVKRYPDGRKDKPPTWQLVPEQQLQPQS